MNRKQFNEEINARIASYDLLRHPFYQAWSAGRLTREDLREYAQDYYHHVIAFPKYLEELAVRLDDAELRSKVLANMADENGMEGAFGQSPTSHSELWLDFAEWTGAPRDLKELTPIREVQELIALFHYVSCEGTPEEAVATFYAYESQVPRVAKEKSRGLTERYGADQHTCAYFTLHATADVYHSGVWQRQLWRRLEINPERSEMALDAARKAAMALWHSLDGIEDRRIARKAA